jgi:hypothetical protein
LKRPEHIELGWRESIVEPPAKVIQERAEALAETLTEALTSAKRAPPDRPLIHELAVGLPDIGGGESHLRIGSHAKSWHGRRGKRIANIKGHGLGTFLLVLLLLSRPYDTLALRRNADQFPVLECPDALAFFLQTVIHFFGHQ